MKERFIYIDIFRGLCMFVVIYSHILHIPKHTRSLSGSLLGYKTIP